MGVWEVGGVGDKNEEGGSEMEGVSIRLAMLDHPCSILKPSPILPHAHTPTPNDHLKAMLNVTD